MAIYPKINGLSVRNYVINQVHIGKDRDQVKQDLKTKGITSMPDSYLSYLFWKASTLVNKGGVLVKIKKSKDEKISSDQELKRKRNQKDFGLTQLFTFFNKRIRPYYKLLNEDIPYNMEQFFIQKEFACNMNNREKKDIGKIFNEICPEITIKRVVELLDDNEIRTKQRERRNLNYKATNGFFTNSNRLRVLNNEFYVKAIGTVSARAIEGSSTIFGAAELTGGIKFYDYRNTFCTLPVRIGEATFDVKCKLGKGKVVLKT